MPGLTRIDLEGLYKKESDLHVKERLFLVLKVLGEGIIPARAARELRRSRTWASDWLARYYEEGLDGLKDRAKSGRPSELPEEVAIRIRKKMRESKRGWTTKQVNDMIVKDGGVKYHYVHIYRLLHKWGFRQNVPRKVHINTASKKEKNAFKKELKRS
jgi:putative transposase